MTDTFQKKILEKSQDTFFDSARKEWVILFKEHKICHCICGHTVKLCSTIYNRKTHNSYTVGTMCCKKYGIDVHCTNQLLISIFKTPIESCMTTPIDQLLISAIEHSMLTHINTREYYRIVPLNRLLTDLNDLQLNYGLSFMSYIEKVQQEIDILEKEMGHKELADRDDISSEISLLSLENTSVVEINEKPDYSISELKQMLLYNEEERNQQMDKLHNLMCENAAQLALLTHRIKTTKESVKKLKEGISDLSQLVYL